MVACDLPERSPPEPVRGRCDRPRSGPSSPTRLDVADPASWKALREFIAEHHGRVDGLINNAGVTSRVRLPDVELEDWNRVLGGQPHRPMLGIKTLLPLMRAGASIVNVGSIAG